MSTFLSPSPINCGSIDKNKTKIDQIFRKKKAKLSVSFFVTEGYFISFTCCIKIFP